MNLRINKMTSDEIDEMAIPSYLHNNPLVRWIVFKRLRCIINLIDVKSDNMTLLDYGCGTGILNLQWPENTLHYTGVDIITWPAEFILSHSGRSRYTILQAENWNENVADSSLDFIICLEVLEHLTVKELLILFSQFMDKLKPTGNIIVSGPTESLFYRLMRKTVGFSGSYHHINIHDIRNNIESKYFEPKKIIHLPIPGFISLFQIIQYKFIK